MVFAATLCGHPDMRTDLPGWRVAEHGERPDQIARAPRHAAASPDQHFFLNQPKMDDHRRIFGFVTVAFDGIEYIRPELIQCFSLSVDATAYRRSRVTTVDFVLAGFKEKLSQSGISCVSGLVLIIPRRCGGHVGNPTATMRSSGTRIPTSLGQGGIRFVRMTQPPEAMTPKSTFLTLTTFGS